MEFEYLLGRNRSLLCLAATMLALALSIGGCHAPKNVSLTISAAASLHDALIQAEAAFNREHPEIVFRNNFDSSGILALEIEQGAPVDVFLSAASKPMDDLSAKGVIAPETRQNLLRNSLVLIAPLDSQLRGFEGLEDKSVRLVALGDPASVPAGQYGKQTLTALHLFDKLNAKLVLAKDVRQVLTYVETGNADAGIVYATDAQASSKVRIVAVAQDSSHDAIVYPAAVVKASRNSEAARRFVEFLSTPAAKAIFTQQGFTIASS